MIINKKSKGVIERNDKPNENWAGNDFFLVDSKSELATKIRNNAPFFDFVLDEKGELMDITPTERPPEPESEPTLEERLEEQEATIANLTECILEMSEYVYQ